jgi:hypothetical protein
MWAPCESLLHIYTALKTNSQDFGFTDKGSVVMEIEKYSTTMANCPTGRL